MPTREERVLSLSLSLSLSHARARAFSLSLSLSPSVSPSFRREMRERRDYVRACTLHTLHTLHTATLMNAHVTQGRAITLSRGLSRHRDVLFARSSGIAILQLAQSDVRPSAPHRGQTTGESRQNPRMTPFCASPDFLSSLSLSRPFLFLSSFALSDDRIVESTIAPAIAAG